MSRKSISLASIRVTCIFQQFEEFGVDLQPLRKGVMLANMSVSEPSFIRKIKDYQLQDPELAKISEHIAECPDFLIVDGVWYYCDRLCMSNIEELKNDIMTQAHIMKYSMHPGSTKIYQNLKGRFWWNNMKREIAAFVSRCMTCQLVKAGH